MESQIHLSKKFCATKQPFKNPRKGESRLVAGTRRIQQDALIREQLASKKMASEFATVQELHVSSSRTFTQGEVVSFGECSPPLPPLSFNLQEILKQLPESS